MIKIQNLNYQYKTGEFSLNDINLEIADGEFVCIIGKNGSGKSSFSRILSGLIPFKNGNIEINSLDLKNKKNALEIRKNVGIVFQNPENQILFDTVYDDLAFALQNFNIPKEEISSRIDDALRSVNMEEYKYSSTECLSLGQKQRIAIASSLCLKPKVLILDEPTSMLDPINKNAIYKTLKALQKQNTTIIYITNNIDEILLSNRILLFENGKIQKDFSKNDLVNHFEDLKDFEIPGILSFIKKLYLNEVSSIQIEDLLHIYDK